MKKEILIVDDEPNILISLEGVLQDEGFSIKKASNGKEALKILENSPPDLVLLDIWLPEIDGIEVLERALKNHPKLKVVMMSGHATIDTAIKATKIGAKTFIDKPISMDELLSTIHRVLEEKKKGTEKKNNIKPQQKPKKLKNIHVLKNRKQKTIKSSIALTGTGLHSGQKTGIILNPAEPDSGIIFEDINSGDIVSADISNIRSTGYATSLSNGSTMDVKTVEHLLAAIHMFQITNLKIKVADEVPIFDGSSLEFCNIFTNTSIMEQEIIIYKKDSQESYIKIEPSDTFEIEYNLSYPEPVGKQNFCFTYNTPEDFIKEIAPARTFCFHHEISMLQKQGLGGGGQLHNVIIVDKDKSYISQKLRFDNEFARHKILDIIGDLYLLGYFVRGKITASMTGHTENVQLVKAIREKIGL